MKVKELMELKLHRDDPEFDEYYDDRLEKEQDLKDAPYAVGWSAQSHEWYGDGNPEGGDGRYKPKGDGGSFVAINVPDFATAQKIANKLDKDYENHKFHDQSVYGHRGHDHYYNDWHGSFIMSMSKVEDAWRFKHDKPKDYSHVTA